MKQYFVIKNNINFPLCSSVIFTTDNKDDAQMYAEIMQRNSEDTAYNFIVGSLCI